MNLKMLMLSIVAMLTLSGCGYITTVDSGEAGVVIVNGSVDDRPIGEGFAFSMNPLASLIKYNIKAKQLEMSGPDGPDTRELMNDGAVNVTVGEGLQVPIDVTLLYSLKSECAPIVRRKFGEDIIWDNKVVVPVAREAVRNVIGRDKNSDIYKLNQNRDKYGDEIQAELMKGVNATIGQNCVVVSMVTIKDIHIPQTYADSIMKKNQMEEEARRAELAVKKAKAEAEIEIAKAEGTAKAQLALTKSITTEMIKWKELENTSNAIAKWDGKLPTTSMSNGVPFINVK
jgi:regulator of protease activity HflC (stomatin/prohibitin superfamily)